MRHTARLSERSYKLYKLLSGAEEGGLRMMNNEEDRTINDEGGMMNDESQKDSSRQAVIHQPSLAQRIGVYDRQFKPLNEFNGS
jgi:hypothetical protein